LKIENSERHFIEHLVWSIQVGDLTLKLFSERSLKL